MIHEIPGGQPSKRPLHFIILADCSGSMNIKGKIQALNKAIRECIPNMKEIAAENVSAEILVRAISFSDGAVWHIASPTKVDNVNWEDLTAEGLTAMGAAFSLVAEQLKMPPMESRALPPVLLLVTDGEPTDEWKDGLMQIQQTKWGQKAVRIAIAIGEDANMLVLEQFINHPEIKPLLAKNAYQLTKYIKWASTAVIQNVSSPKSQTTETTDSTHFIQLPIDQNQVDDEVDDQLLRW